MANKKLTDEEFEKMYREDENFRFIIEAWPYLSEWAKFRIWFKIMHDADQGAFWRLLRWLENEFKP